MNHDDNDKKPNFDLWIDPELEARIVAWVTGEESDFEEAELERLVAEKPELALFRDRIQAAHELATEAMQTDSEPLRLSPERRADLLAKIAEPVVTEEGPQTAVVERSRPNSWRKWIPAGSISLAASFVLVFGIIRLGSDQLGWKAADLSPQGGSLPPAPEAKRVNAQLNSLELMVDQGGAGAAAPGEAGMVLESMAHEESAQSPIMFRRRMLKQDTDRTYAREPADELENRSRRENRPMTAGITASSSLKNEGVDKKGFYETGDLDRVDAAKPAAASVRTQAMLVGASMDGPDANRAERAKEMPEAEALFSLSPFELAKDEEDSDYRSTGTLAGARMEPLEPPQAWDSATTFADDGSFVGGKEPKAMIAFGESDHLQKSRSIAAEVHAADEPVSTFSLHVSDVSFRTAQAALERGEWPEPATIRPEEFYNAFDYGDPAATAAEKIACRIDQAAHPILQQRNFVRIAMKVPSTGRGTGQPLNLTVLVDTSGSMEREDRRESVENAMDVLSTLLGPEDQVNVIGFARQPRLLEEAMPGDQAHRLAEVVANTPSEGGTNLEAALELSVELAQRHYDPKAQNRIVLMTDGAANLGDADHDSFTETIERVRQRGISFDATGIGTDGMNDAVLEALTRKGNGRYYVIDRPEDADAGFASQLAGAFRPAAENVKVQVRFNPARVGNYRLIGFEKHRLNEEDFRDDRIDAAELAAEEAAVAVYQIEVLPEGEGELGEVYVRFRDAASGEMVERSWTAPYDAHAPTFDRASPQVQLAGTAALVAEALRGDPMGEQIWLDDLAETVEGFRIHYAYEDRVQELVGMVEHLRRIQNSGTE